MLPPFFDGNHYQPGCTHPSSEEVSLRSAVASLQNIELWVLVEPLDHGLNDNLIGNCRRLSSQTQEPSNVCLHVLLMVLRALEQGLSSDWLRLKALKAGD
jgi:hypothetical protein